jgi:hypothetical protein
VKSLRSKYTRRRGEEGAALPLALAALIICSIVTAIIAQYTSAADLASAHLGAERNNVYAANGAIDAAIKWAESDPASPLVRGVAAGSTPQTGTCATSAPGTSGFFTVTAPNGVAINVSCVAVPSSGQTITTTTAPGFAILTLAPYQGTWPDEANSCRTANDELGIVEVQSSKLLYVNGPVNVNSDVDADTYGANGCVNPYAAQPIVVLGNTLHRESPHDLCAGKYDYNFGECALYLPLTSAYSNAPDTSTWNPWTPTAAQAAQLADPAIAAPAVWAPNPPAAAVNPPAKDASGNVVTTCTSTIPPRDPNTHFRVVQFFPGTYTNAAFFNAFTNGTCFNTVFYFNPGNYYFNFTNAGSHEWDINDATARVVGGQPNQINQAATNTTKTWKSLAVKNVAGFTTNTNNAMTIDGATADATFSSGTQTVEVSNYSGPSGSTTIPPDAQINSVVLRVQHSEDSTKVQAPTATITTATGVQCPAQTIASHSTLSEDDYDVTSCLSDPTRINPGGSGSVTIDYAVSKCTAGTCSGSTTAHFDGIWLDVTYTTPPRPVWDPTKTSTITASTPSVPGACRHDGDTNWSDGVQFVVGGDSHINLQSGKFELCDQPSGTKQEIVLYAPKAPALGSWAPAVNTTGSYTNPGTNGFTNPDYGSRIGGAQATAQLSTTTPTRTITYKQLTPSTWPIPSTDTIPAGVTIKSVRLLVNHWESNTAQINAPTVQVTPAGGTPCAAATLATHAAPNPAVPVPDVVDLSSCITTPAQLNGGLSINFSVTKTAGTTTPTESLDGFLVQVTYNAPAGSQFAPSTGCVTQAPYYDPWNHSPRYSGACAVFKVSGNSEGGTAPRILTLWGTVYAPSAALDTPVDVLTVPVFNRGVVARTVMLGYNVANNAEVPITTTPLVGSFENRRMTLTANVTGASTTVVADVELCDYGCTNVPPGTRVKIWSWKLTR